MVECVTLSMLRMRVRDGEGMGSWLWLHSWSAVEPDPSWSDSEACSLNQDVKDIFVPGSKLLAVVGSLLKFSFSVLSSSVEGGRKERALWNRVGIINCLFWAQPSCWSLKLRLSMAATEQR